MIVDGAKALDTAVTQTFGRAALVQRCQVHKGRNILERLPEAQRPWVKAGSSRAPTRTATVKTAKRLLQDLARRLDTDDPSAATSVREGLDETLIVLGLGLSERLQRSLATTNAIENLLSRTRHVQRHVKRWRGGTMVLRWVAAGVLADPLLNHQVEVVGGVLKPKCRELICLFFAERRTDAGATGRTGHEWSQGPSGLHGPRGAELRAAGSVLRRGPEVVVTGAPRKRLVGVTGTWVRIPLSPPCILDNHFIFNVLCS